MSVYLLFCSVGGVGGGAGCLVARGVPAEWWGCLVGAGENGCMNGDGVGFGCWGVGRGGVWVVSGCLVVRLALVELLRGGVRVVSGRFAGLVFVGLMVVVCVRLVLDMGGIFGGALVRGSRWVAPMSQLRWAPTC